MEDDIAARLEKTRRQKNLSLRELAARSGVDRKTCSNIEICKVQLEDNITIGTLKRLASVLGVRPGWLAFGESSPAGKVDRANEVISSEWNFLLSAASPDDSREDQDPNNDGWDWDDQDTRAPYDPDADPEPLLTKRDPVWQAQIRMHRPDSHRQPGALYLSLPPLPLEFEPVLVALGRSSQQRPRVSKWLLDILRDFEESSTATATAQRCLRQVLEHRIPRSERAVVERVMAELGHASRLHRGLMVLALIADAGLPVYYTALLDILRDERQHGLVLHALADLMEMLGMLNGESRLQRPQLGAPAPVPLLPAADCAPAT